MPLKRQRPRLMNIAKTGIAIPYNLSLNNKGHVTAVAKIGVKLGGWGINLYKAKAAIKKIILKKLFFIVYFLIPFRYYNLLYLDYFN